MLAAKIGKSLFSVIAAKTISLAKDKLIFNLEIGSCCSLLHFFITTFKQNMSHYGSAYAHVILGSTKEIKKGKTLRKIISFCIHLEQM